MAQHWRLTTPAFQGLHIQGHTSEFVLGEAYPNVCANRIQRLFSSQTYRRTLAMEMFGINKVLTGKYTSYSSVKA